MVACPICNVDANRLCDREVDSIYQCQNASCRHRFSYPQPNDEQHVKFYAEDYYDGRTEI